MERVWGRKQEGGEARHAKRGRQCFLSASISQNFRISACQGVKLPLCETRVYSGRGWPRVAEKPRDISMVHTYRSLLRGSKNFHGNFRHTHAHCSPKLDRVDDSELRDFTLETEGLRIVLKAVVLWIIRGKPILSALGVVLEIILF